MTAAAGSLLLAEQGEFPDIEAVVMDLLSDVEIDGDRIGDRTGTRTPTEDALPFIHIFRAVSAGGMNAGGWSDLASLYIATWARTRGESRQMIRGVRDLLAPFGDGGDHRGVFIDRAWETSAPGPLPVLDEDDRRVELGYAFRVRRHNRPAVYV